VPLKRSRKGKVTQAPRVRIAPSPTGMLHVGTARTALYNYLYAKRNKGTFIFRLEDTDAERSHEDYTQDIIEGLHWLGLTWDEGPDIGGPYAPYRQTEKVDHYDSLANKLVSEGAAYFAYETQEELAAIKEEQGKNSQGYDNRGRHLQPEAAEKYQAEGRIPSIRFRIEEPRVVSWHDAVKGEISFSSSELGGDMVIVKSNGVAIYNFAVVIDDIDMKMTHVIRGEDHISNTAKQILLYEALGYQKPEFAHVPLMNDTEHKKLSKRAHGESVHISFYRANGYMPEAIVNYLAQMSWTAPNGKEIFSLEEACQMFSLDRVSKSPAVFDTQRLDWFNSHYIRELPLATITQRAKAWLDPNHVAAYERENKLEELVASVREGLTKLSEITAATAFYFATTLEISQDVKETVLKPQTAKQVLDQTLKNLSALPWGDQKGCKAVIDGIGKELSVKGKDLYWPLRAALSGKTQGPDLGSMLSVLGEKRVRERLEAALGLCRSI
jgi:nondiscriminating glutamyl-tRNA synthetase